MTPTGTTGLPFSSLGFQEAKLRRFRSAIYPLFSATSKSNDFIFMYSPECRQTDIVDIVSWDLNTVSPIVKYKVDLIYFQVITG